MSHSLAAAWHFCTQINPDGSDVIRLASTVASAQQEMLGLSIQWPIARDGLESDENAPIHGDVGCSEVVMEKKLHEYPSPRPTMRDVAHLAGVSMSTVSNYLSSYPYMKPTTRSRIKNAIETLGYVTNQRARSLRSGRTMIISLSIPSLTQIYFAELSEEVISYARERGYGVIVESTGFKREQELASVSNMNRKMTDGLIFSPFAMRQSDTPRLRGNYPLVVLGEKLFDVPAPHVVVKNVEISRRLTAHLIDKGCTDIVFAGGRLKYGGASTEALRTRGYVEALCQAGLPVRKNLIRELDHDSGDTIATSHNGAQVVKQIIAENIHFDSIVCYNDLIAYGVVRQLRELQVDIPGEVRVVSIDDLVESQYVIPSLTTVDPGRARIAKLSVDLVLQQLDSDTRAPGQEIPVDYGIRYRESSPE